MNTTGRSLTRPVTAASPAARSLAESDGSVAIGPAIALRRGITGA
jgi:hypothetical protein